MRVGVWVREGKRSFLNVYLRGCFGSASDPLIFSEDGNTMEGLINGSWEATTVRRMPIEGKADTIMTSGHQQAAAGRMVFWSSVRCFPRRCFPRRRFPRRWFLGRWFELRRGGLIVVVGVVFVSSGRRSCCSPAAGRPIFDAVDSVVDVAANIHLLLNVGQASTKLLVAAAKRSGDFRQAFTKQNDGDDTDDDDFLRTHSAKKREKNEI